jgi:hypothetical protein
MSSDLTSICQALRAQFAIVMFAQYLLICAHNHKHEIQVHLARQMYDQAQAELQQLKELTSKNSDTISRLMIFPPNLLLSYN